MWAAQAAHATASDNSSSAASCSCPHPGQRRVNILRRVSPYARVATSAWINVLTS